MKVVLASFGFYPLIGGVENSILNFARVFKKKGWDVVVLTTSKGTLYEETVTFERLFDIEVVRINDRRIYGFRLNSFLSSILSVIIFYQRILKYKSYFFDSDLIIARDYRILVALKLAFWQKKSAYVIPGFVSDQDTYYLHGSFLKRFLKRSIHINQILLQFLACKVADRIFVFSEIMLQKALSVRSDAVRIYPGVDRNRFEFNPEYRTKVREEFGIDKESKVVLCLGRLEVQKGFINILKAWANVKYCDFLFIVGSGSLDSLLKREVEDSNISNVVFVGGTDYPEHYYSMADIFFHSSIYEPFGQTIVEAAASGIPIVALHENYCETATKEIMGDMVSYVSLDSVEIANCLDSLSTFTDRSSSLYTKILSKYSWDQCVDSILVYFNRSGIQ